MKKSFTLIEVIISVIIFSILMIFMSNTIDSLNSSINVLSKNFQKNKQTIYITKTLYLDILNHSKISLINNNKNYSVLELQTSNSLYGISMPYVIWYVSKNKNSLMRLESAKKITLPISSDDEDIFLDKFQENTDIFKIYQSDNNYLIFIKNLQSNIYFEISKYDKIPKKKTK